MALIESKRWRKTEDPPSENQDDGAGEKCPVDSTEMEESVAKSAKWSGEEAKELSSD